MEDLGYSGRIIVEDSLLTERFVKVISLIVVNLFHIGIEVFNM